MLWQRLMWIFCTCGSRVSYTQFRLWRKYYTSDLENMEKKKKYFFASGFGFVGRDGNRGVDLVLLWVGLVLQVISRSGFCFAIGLFFFLFFFSFFLLLLLLSASFFFLFVSQISKTKSSAWDSISFVEIEFDKLEMLVC